MIPAMRKLLAAVLGQSMVGWQLASHACGNDADAWACFFYKAAVVHPRGSPVTARSHVLLFNFTRLASSLADAQ